MPQFSHNIIPPNIVHYLKYFLKFCLFLMIQNRKSNFPNASNYLKFSHKMKMEKTNKQTIL